MYFFGVTVLQCQVSVNIYLDNTAASAGILVFQHIPIQVQRHGAVNLQRSVNIDIRRQLYGSHGAVCHCSDQRRLVCDLLHILCLSLGKGRQGHKAEHHAQGKQDAYKLLFHHVSFFALLGSSAQGIYKNYRGKNRKLSSLF